jgi:putative Mn2+ efflux pump MntP
MQIGQHGSTAKKAWLVFHLFFIISPGKGTVMGSLKCPHPNSWNLWIFYIIRQMGIKFVISSSKQTVISRGFNVITRILNIIGRGQENSQCIYLVWKGHSALGRQEGLLAKAEKQLLEQRKARKHFFTQQAFRRNTALLTFSFQSGDTEL